MRASLALASSQHLTKYVTNPGSLTFVSCNKSLSIHCNRLHWQQSSTRVELINPARRYLSSIRSHRNHLHNVKEYTAKNPTSIWQSTSNNPYENLAIENYLLKNSDPSSKILFTYVNRPCVVIGRNQNPWLECNLARMQEGLPYHKFSDSDQELSPTSRMEPLRLVRRRSGGGTVIHDVGNLNFSFIVPNDKDFTRDKHGELVAEMLQQLRSRCDMKPYFSSVRVNERHDIVMKVQGKSKAGSSKEFKVSGSAFKLTRGRALHHGTILHSSPNIQEQSGVDHDRRSVFSEVLSSPAKSYLEAKGVGSVRSPVHNLFKAEDTADRLMYNREIHRELQKTFRKASNVASIDVQLVGASDCTEESNRPIFDDIQELLTLEWQFCQTPSFEYTSSHEDGEIHIHFQVKHGIIGPPTVKDGNGDIADGYESLVGLEGQKLHEIDDWSSIIPSAAPSSTSITRHLTTIFPNVARALQVRPKPIATSSMKIANSKEIQREGTVIEKRSTDGSVETEKEGESLVVER